MRKMLLDSSVRVALIGCCLAAAMYALMLSRAELAFRGFTASAVASAIRLAPSNPTYVAALAELEPAHRVGLLHRALSLNGFDSKSLIQLGFDAEFQQHDAGKAEQYFKQAATVDKMFLPRLTLANFYFRQERIPEFLEWVRHAYRDLSIRIQSSPALSAVLEQRCRSSKYCRRNSRLRSPPV